MALMMTGLVMGFLARSASAQINWTEEDRQTMRQRREAHAPRIEIALVQAQNVQKSNPDLALDILQRIFDSPEDSYYVTASGCSLKDAAEVVLLSDREGLLKAYERRFESAAAGLLDKAHREGDRAGLLEVARRYSLTPAGRTAMYEIATSACDLGDASTALRFVQRLRRSPPDLDRFEPHLSLVELWAQRELSAAGAVNSLLERLKKQFPEGLPVNGRALPWFSEEAGRDAWLDRLLSRAGSREPTVGLATWRLPHGNLRANAVSSDAPVFLDGAWKAPLADRYDDFRQYDDPWNDADIKLVNQSAADVESKYRNEGLHPLPVATPLITNDLAIVAGFGTVKAYDLKTGQLAWSSQPVDQTLSALLTGTDANVRPSKAGLLQQFVGQRAYRDHVDAALSTDGKRVYHVGHSGLVGLQPYPSGLPASNRGVSPLLPRNYNHLQAYDINGGRCLWSIGGPPRRLEVPFDRPDEELDLDGAFFCMPPIPWEGQLLCVVEQSRQLRVVAIDPESNPEHDPPLWSQAILNSDVDLVYSPDRRFAGVNVAIDGSTLVAAVGNGTVIGFDLANRRWLWLTTYTDPQPVDYRRQLQINRMNRQVTEDSNLGLTVESKEWSDGRTLITGRFVLVTPFDDSRFYCFDRDTGATVWSRPRDQAMFLAGEHDGTVLLVGKSDVRGLATETGQLQWTTSIPPASGRGVRLGSRYSLPLSTAEVVTFDIKSGAPLARSQLVSEKPAGNLASAAGILVTQTASELRAFRSDTDVESEIRDRLARDAGDPAALALRGELKLHRGEVAEGERDLKSIAEPPKRVQRVLAWAFVNGLERDFENYFKPDINLDELPTDPALRIQAWSAVAKGLEARGDLPGALLAALRAGENINAQSDRLLDRADSLRIRENRLVRGRLHDLWRSMSPEQKTESVARIRDRLTLLNPGAPELFRVHELLHGEIMPADLELDYLERRLSGATALIEQRLLRLRESADPLIAARANLQLLRIAVQDPRMMPAPAVIAELKGRLKDVPLADEKTAGELASEALADPAFQKRRDAAPVLSGELVVSSLEDSSGLNELPFTLSELGPRSPILEGWTFVTEGTQQQLFSVDPRGVVGRFQERINRGMTGGPGRVSTCGRLVLAETVDGFRVFDAVAQTSVSTTILMTETLDPFMGANFGRVKFPGNYRTGRQVAPLNSEHLAYIKGSQLIVADPLTGREYWTRTVEGIVDIFSDLEHVAVLDGRGKVKVYRAVDGRLVRETEFPPGTPLPEYRLDIQRLIRQDAKDQVTVGLFDPANNRWTWQKNFPALTRFDVLDGRDLVVLQPGGELSILSTVDGRESTSSRLDVPESVQRLRVFQDGARIYLLAEQHSIGAQFLSTPALRDPPVKARLICLNRGTGEQLWSRDFDRLQLSFSQPGQWPFLMVTAAGEPDEAAVEQKVPVPTWAYLIDRASGKTLHAAELMIGSGSQRAWKTDPATGAVSLRINGTGIQVANRPVQAPAPSPAPAAAPVPPAKDDGEASPPPPPEPKRDN